MNRRGFTLLEVLVATSLMAIAITGLLSSLSTSLRNQSRLTDYDRAALLARRKMDELMLTPRLPRLVPLEGTFTEEPGWPAGWRAQVTPFDAPPGAGPGMMILDRVQLEVWWESGDGRRKTFALDGYKPYVLTEVMR